MHGQKPPYGAGYVSSYIRGVDIYNSCLCYRVYSRAVDKSSKKKVKTNDDYVNGLKRRILAETRAQTKKARKKNRKASKKNGETYKTS